MTVRSIIGLGFAALLAAGCSAADPATSPDKTVTHAPVTSSPTSGPKHLPTSGAIEPGRYVMEKGPFAAASFSLTMPAGWTAQNSGQSIGKHPDDSDRELGFSVSIVERLFADPCGQNDTLDIAQTSESLANGLKALPGIEVSFTQPISIGGRSGLRIGLTPAPEVDLDSCDPPIGLQIWLDRSGNKYFVLGRESEGAVYALDAPRERHVEGIDNELFVLVAGHRHTSSPEDVAELTAILESIEFEP